VGLAAARDTHPIVAALLGLRPSGCRRLGRAARSGSHESTGRGPALRGPLRRRRRGAGTSGSTRAFRDTSR